MQALQQASQQQKQQQQKGGVFELQQVDNPTAAGMESRAVAVGFAANGAKVSTHAAAHVQQPAASGGLSASLANATAVANHASHALAIAKSGSGNMVKQGYVIADTTAEAVADHASTATADSGSRSMGLGGITTSAGTTTRAAATDGSRSIVAGTAVSSAVKPGSTAHVISDSTGAAAQHSISNTRADSITVAVDGSSATGSATSTASSQQHGAAVSQSLMESFSVFNHSATDANSLATAHGSKGGVGWSRDKAVGIGLWSSQAATNTSSHVVSSKLGLAIVTSVVRSITAQGRLACADAIRRAAAEAASGPSFNINDVTLHLGGKAPQQCLKSYKDLVVQHQKRVESVAEDPATEFSKQVQDFQVRDKVVQGGMAPLQQLAQGKVDELLKKWVPKQQG